jgi:hypothetical protein
MSFTLQITIDGVPQPALTNLTPALAYKAAMKPEMRVGPNRWHVMMWDYANSKMQALGPGESVDIAWQHATPNPEDEVTRITITRQVDPTP